MVTKFMYVLCALHVGILYSVNPNFCVQREEEQKIKELNSAACKNYTECPNVHNYSYFA